MQGIDRKQTLVPARRVPVMLPYPFPGPFDYSVPQLDPQAGDIVLVSLNHREAVGVVWDAPIPGRSPGRPTAG